ncbi:MAG: PAS domain-containing protein [Burkholderiaceae bacterium]|nr:PAS domain-containing protein [Burkholderiaceae bacterium]
MAAERAPSPTIATAVLHRQEVARLRLLDALGWLDAEPVPALDALVRAAARAAGGAGAALNLVTAQQVWCKAGVGGAARVAPRSTSPCARVVATDAPLLVPSAAEAAEGEARSHDPAAACAYAGVPLRVEGLPVGTLCVSDAAPRAWDDSLLAALQDLALVAEALLASRLRERRESSRREHLHGTGHAGSAWWEADAAVPPAAAAEDLLRRVLDGLPAGVAVSDAAGRIVFANAAWHEQLGDAGPSGPPSWHTLVRHLAYGGHYPDAVGREEQFVAWRLGLVGDAPALQEIRWRDGWGLVGDRRLPGGHVVHLSFDHTAAKRSEDERLALQRRQLDADAHLSAVLAAIPDLWFVVDARGRFSRASTPRHASLSRPFEQLVGREVDAGLPPAAAEAARAAMQRATALGRVQRYEFDVPGADGAVRHFEARVSPMPGGELLVLTRDLTESRTLARDVLLMQRAFESPASLPIVIADALAPGLPLVYANTAFERLAGWSRDAVQGWQFEDLAATGTPGREPLAQALRRGGDAAVVIETRRRDGGLFTAELTIVAARDADGRTTHLIGLLRDISERQQAEQARRDKLVAEMASRSKSEFMSRMSHEMRTPLNAIIGFAQLLRLQSGARLDHVDHILNAGRHLLTLVNDVLDLQRAETGDLALKPEAVALSPLVDDCLAMLQPMADARGVHQQRAGAAVALHALADAQRLRQVLLNIGSNAVKYNRPGGRVTWSIEALADGRCAVAIDDTGTGMSPDQLARLFQPFERLGRDTSTIEGTGLGLVISRRLVEAMGGALEIDSRPGRGTRMHVVLPAAPTVAAEPAAPGRGAAAVPPAVPAAGVDPLRLLYVEDNRINALLFEEALRRHPGFDLRVAEDGAEALEVVQDWYPDVLVLDANLPGASGHEVLQQLRRLDALADAPAYMCSADAMPADVQRALDAGFRAYWTKPLDIEVIVDELQRLRRERAGLR